MKICVIGKGWVGSKIFIELSSRSHFVDFLSHNCELNKNYDWVINCAGYTGYPNVDACENNKSETIKANAYFPVLLYEKCKQLGSKFAHFSSGCIYQGQINSVDEEPNYFGSIYSVTKGMSDSYLKNKSLIFRIRMPFVSDNIPKNLFTKLINYSKNGKLYDGGFNSITDLDEAIKTACNLMENNEHGPFNLVNEGSVTNHEIACMLGLKDAQWYTEEEFAKNTTASRSNCVIPCNCGMRDVRQALSERIEKLKYNMS